MSLPVLSTPTFDVKIISLGKNVKFRPFLVKEEKILILAAESEDPTEMLSAMQNIVTSCSDGAVDGKTLPFFDLQNAFIKLRGESIGGETEFNLICGECSHRTPTSLDLKTIQVKTDETHTNKINLTDDIGIIMKYPDASLLVDKSLKTYDIVLKCIDKIYTKEEVFDAADETPEELARFVDGLTSEQFERIANFFVTMPKIEHVIEYKCPNCSADNVVIMDGIESFFV